MVVNNRYFNNVNKIVGTQNTQRPEQIVTNPGRFNEILKDRMEKNSAIKFSKHAELRLQSRNIHLSQDQKDKLRNAVEKAEVKGVRDTLVLLDNMAFVVNVKNRTVITAVNSNELKENVFTNIDGAVFT